MSRGEGGPGPVGLEWGEGVGRGGEGWLVVRLWVRGGVGYVNQE